MEMFFKYINVVSVSFWVGGITLFSFIQAPQLFRKLKNEQAGDCVAVMFPGYYALGYVCAAVAIISTIYLGGAGLSLVILIIMLALSLTGGLYFLPRVNAVKKELRKKKTPELKDRFSFLHKGSIVANMLVWLGGMFILYFISMR